MKQRYDKGHTIFSIFGQIEAVVARTMIDEGKARFIEARAIPSSAAINEKGEWAQFAIVLPNKNLYEFEERIRDLRA